MSFVFLSHADADKQRLRYIVDALIAAGLQVWLDNPVRMGFSQREAMQHFRHLDPGRQWREQINEGLRGAGCVLVCWSEQAKGISDVWKSEASYARTEQKLVACRIDDVDYGALPDGHGAEQIADLRVDEPASAGASRVPRDRALLNTALAQFIDVVKAKMKATTTRGFEARVRSGVMRDTFARFLIDRVDQEGMLARAMDTVKAEGGVRPALVAGPENECLDQFIERLRRYRRRERLSDEAWYEVRVEWPGRKTPEQFGAEYRSRLAAELGLPTIASDQDVAAALAHKQRTVAIVSPMRAQEWQVSEPQRIAAWLEWWQALAKGPVGFAAIPLISIKLPKAKPSWKECPGGQAPGATVSNTEIWRAVQRLAGQGGGGLLSLLGWRKPAIPGALDVPPLLHPVTLGHVESWFREHCDMMVASQDKVQEEIDKLFADSAAQSHGVALEDFANAMKPMFAV